MATESQSFDSDLLASHFERSVWGSYVMSPKPQPQVYKLKDDAPVDEYEIADVRRSRKRALESNVQPIPVFSPLDEVVVRTEPEIGDLNFVTRDAKGFVRHLG